MKFVVGASNVKIFAKSILALSKVGDEIYIEPLKDSLTLRTVNSSKSAFTCFSFKQAFFTFFEPELTKNLANNPNNLNNTTILHERTNCNESLIEESEPFKCKIPSKCLCSIFKNISSMEKNIEKCTITVKYIPLSQDTMAKAADYDSTMVTKLVNKNNEEQLYDTKFLIIMHSKYGLRKTFILSISDCENLQAAFLADSCSNKLNISAKYFHETINSFSNDTEEITFVVEANKLIIKNYIEPDNAEIKALINTQVSFDCDEFNSYDIDSEMDVTFCLKEFKICLLFGYWFDLPLSIYFKKKGRPIIFMYENSTSHYDVNFTLATLADELTSQSTCISSHANNIASSIQQTSELLIRKTNSLRKNNEPDANDSVSEAAAANIQKTLNENNNNTNRNKGNKRTLFDASYNQVYLSDAGNQNDDAQMICQDHDSAEEDAMLTQALNEQENNDAYKSHSQHQEIVQRPPPPKKIKSIIELLSENDDENDEENSRDKQQSNTTKKITLANLLNADSSDESTLIERRIDSKKQHTSIYIKDTDSEEEED